MERAVTIRRAEGSDAPEIARIHITSRKLAMPWLASPHTDEETHWWVEHVMIVNDEVWVAEANGTVIGFAAMTPGWLEHLYIDPAFQGQGIGRGLLDHAKMRQLDGLQLWAFARNDRARRFYEAAGFVLIEETDGSGNEEREPDVLYLWKP